MRTLFVVVVALTLALVAASFVAGDGAQRVRDRHGNPTPQATPPTVAVVRGTTLYHAAWCRFIHGTPVLEPAATAAAQGYVPCPRCLGVLRAESQP